MTFPVDRGVALTLSMRSMRTAGGGGGGGMTFQRFFKHYSARNEPKLAKCLLIQI